MIAFGFLVLLIGFFVLINTLNGNLPGLVDIPGVHDATVAIRGLMDTTKKVTTSSIPTDANGNPLLTTNTENLGDFLNQQYQNNPQWVNPADNASKQAQADLDYWANLFGWANKPAAGKTPGETH